MEKDLPEIKLAGGSLDYRQNISKKYKYSWLVRYKYSDILISSDKDISAKISGPLQSFYDDLEGIIKKDSSFYNSLKPISIKDYYTPEAGLMRDAAELFGVGPMATVAGAVCEYLADNLLKYCEKLVIENGGDTLVVTDEKINIGLYVKNRYFNDSITIQTRSAKGRFSVCSSSSTFGHSMSLGKCDLAVAMADSAVYADAAATSIANSVKDIRDIDGMIKHYSTFDQLTGIVVIKDKKIGLWGNLKLA